MNLSKELQIIEQELMALLPILKGHLSSHDEELLIEFITHLEWGLAFEEIVATISFYNILISQEQYEEIMRIGLKLEFKESDWSKIKRLVK